MARSSEAAARAGRGALQVRRCGFETRSAGRGWFWPKGRRRPSRVRISMAPCSEGRGAGRVWWSPGQHSSFSTPGAYFQFAHPLRTSGHCGVSGVCRSSPLVFVQPKDWQPPPSCVYSRSHRAVSGVCPRRTRDAALFCVHSGLVTGAQRSLRAANKTIRVLNWRRPRPECQKRSFAARSVFAGFGHTHLKSCLSGRFERWEGN